MAMALNFVLIGLDITLDSLPLTAFIAVLPSKRSVTKARHSCSAGCCP